MTKETMCGKALQPVFRFAPSPNGYLHLGHAFSALTNRVCATELNGKLLLRIEDIDKERCKQEYEEAILEDLAWLGVTWDQPLLRQSNQSQAYECELSRLTAMGLVYPCFLTRGEIKKHAEQFEADNNCHWPRDPDGGYLAPDISKNLNSQKQQDNKSRGMPFALRLDMEKALNFLRTHKQINVLNWQEGDMLQAKSSKMITADPAAWGDVVLVRKDGAFSYHLSSIIDDELTKVTHIVRGRDLYHSTSVHRMLQELLGYNVPNYFHHKLILDDTGEKLSKSSASTSIRHLREKGATLEGVKAMINC